MSLILYLDTQDYIRLFNEAKGGPSHVIADEIAKYRDRGDVAIGFSFVTIAEFITKPTDEYRHERVGRGQLIKDICGPNAFPSLSDLAKGATFPNNGQWILSFTDRSLSAKKMRSMFRSKFSERVLQDNSLNRKQRRQLHRKGSMEKFLHDRGSTWGRKRSDWGDFPISNELLESRIFERFLKGQCSDREFEDRIYSWISDPVEYSRIMYDYSGSENVIEKYFGKAISEFQNSLEKVHGIIKDTQKLNSDIEALRASMIKAGSTKARARKILPKVSPSGLSQDHLKILEESVGEGRAGHFGHYIDKIWKQKLSFKRSDVMDLMQMCYAYDCDLFRCDKAMASIFDDYAPFSGKLVSRFSDLPYRIEELRCRSAD